MQSRSTPACRRARGGQGRALRWPQMRPALTGPARGGCEIDGRDGRMARGAAEQKNVRTAISAIVISVKKNRLREWETQMGNACFKVVLQTCQRRRQGRAIGRRNVVP